MWKVLWGPLQERTKTQSSQAQDSHARLHLHLNSQKNSLAPGVHHWRQFWNFIEADQATEPIHPKAWLSLFIHHHSRKSANVSLSLSRWYDSSSLFLWSLSPGPCLHCSGLTASVCSQKKRWSSLEKGLSLLWTTWMSLLCNIASIGFQTHGFEMESGFGVENPFQLESRWIEIYWNILKWFHEFSFRWPALCRDLQQLEHESGIRSSKTKFRGQLSSLFIDVRSHNPTKSGWTWRFSPTACFYAGLTWIVWCLGVLILVDGYIQVFRLSPFVLKIVFSGVGLQAGTLLTSVPILKIRKLVWCPCGQPHPCFSQRAYPVHCYT